jgi:hypothetical protein
MGDITLRFNCDLCKKTIALKLTEAFQTKFKSTADYWPYPMIYPHDGHWSIIFLDEQFKERGVSSSRMLYEE